jgi:signal peptidase I
MIILFGFSFTVVTTSSMKPTYEGYITENSTLNIFNSDFIVLQKKSPEIGDVVLFRPIHDTRLYFHRIIASKVENNITYFLTKGDNNRYTDANNLNENKLGWIPEGNIFGVAVITIHWIGWFINEITSINFIISFLGIILLVGYFVVFTKKENKPKLQEKKFRVVNLKIKLNKKDYSINKNLLKYILVIALISSILLSTLLIELFSASNSNINVELLQTDNKPLPELINLNDPHLFDLESYEINGQIVSLLNFKLKIYSGGFFKSTESVKIQIKNINESLNTLDNSFYYEWISTYHFTGSKVINGILLIPNGLISNLSNNNLIVDIDITFSNFFVVNHFYINRTISFV